MDVKSALSCAFSDFKSSIILSFAKSSVFFSSKRGASMTAVSEVFSVTASDSN